MKVSNIYDYEVVGIKNIDLTIRHLCQGAMSWMYPRELYVNAQESSEKYILDKSPTVPVKIYIGALSVNDLLVDESVNELAFTKPKHTDDTISSYIKQRDKYVNETKKISQMYLDIFIVDNSKLIK